MTLMSSISKLTTSVDQLTAEVNVSKATLDAKVAQAAAEVVSAQADQALAEGYRATTATHAADAATHLAAVKAGVAYQGIAAILASKAVTAIDVFVYDTSLDSDGGAWRKRCQHTSWYNEPLNTATRGARREFPAVAVIVAATGSITIYDGDDPALPMWMVFTGATAWNYMFTFGNAPAGVTSVACLNGRLAITTTSSATNASTNGVFEIVFPADTGFKTRGVGRYKWQTNIADRNASTTASWLNNTIIGPAILSDYLNDVAMTVLPDAPIDPATGLPVPTIAVATAGGVSVIKDDGTVVSTQMSTNQGGPLRKVSIFGTKVATSGIGLSAYYGQDVWDFATGQKFLMGSLGPGSLGLGANSNVEQVGFANDESKYVGRYWLGGQGLGIINWGDFGKSLALGRTSAYNTGWMPGAIKGAFLADTDATALASEDYSIQTLTLADFVIPTNNVVITDLGDRFRITRNAEAGSTVQVRVDAAVASLVVGKLYFAEFEILATGPSNNAYTSASHGGGTTFISAGYTTGNTKRNQFSVATGAGTGGVRFEFSVSRGANPASSIEGDWIEIAKTLTVRRADADRSVNNKGLIVNGTITRSPVADGAELVGYSGFSASNYLEQPYNSALDFGTGDFCVMGWHKSTGSNNNADIFARTTLAPVVDDRIIRLTRWALGRYSFAVSRQGIGGDGVEYQAGNITHWAHIVCIRRGGTLELWIDGRLVASGPSATDASQPGAVFRLGHYGYSLNGSSALWRVSATAPTADQIRRIYEDERRLFQPGAQCTLYGTSDVVTALAHDPKTNLLHVGTSAGRSTFDGLVRVANTTTPVATAISAVNGLIAEQ